MGPDAIDKGEVVATIVFVVLSTSFSRGFLREVACVDYPPSDSVANDVLGDPMREFTVTVNGGGSLLRGCDEWGEVGRVGLAGNPGGVVGVF